MASLDYVARPFQKIKSINCACLNVCPPDTPAHIHTPQKRKGRWSVAQLAERWPNMQKALGSMYSSDELDEVSCTVIPVLRCRAGTGTGERKVKPILTYPEFEAGLPA